MQDYPYILGFTAGELSPWLSTRFDLPQHRKGAARIENFLVEPYGGVTRRHGSSYKADCYDQEGNTRFFPFTFSEDDYLLLELYPGGIRFWNQDDWLRTSTGDIYTLETPWTSGEVLRSLRFIQVNDVVFVTSPSIYPSQIKRLDDVYWVYETCSFNPMPKGPQICTNEEVRIYRIGSSDTDYVVDLPDNFPTRIYDSEIQDIEHVVINATVDSAEYYLEDTFDFSPTVVTSILSARDFDIGQVIAIKIPNTTHYQYYTVIRQASFAYIDLDSHPSQFPSYFSPGVAWLPSTGKPLYVPGGWSLQTSGTWDSNWELRRAYPSATDLHADDYRLWDWMRVHQFSQTAYTERQNWAFSNFEKEPSYMILTCLDSKTFSGASPFYFRVEQSTHDVKLRVIGSYNYGQKKLRVRLEDPLVSLPDDFYPRQISFSAFGMINGYPSFCGMHEGRLWLGGTVAQPTTLRASALDDFYNFRLGSDANHALELTLASSKQSRMCWMSTERGLLLGTSDAEWLLVSGDGSGISTTSASFRKESTIGSENKEAHGVENSVFYVQRGGKRLREISYKLEADGYTSTDTSLFAEHLFKAGIKEWAVQRGSSTRVWVLMEDHTVAVLTTNVAQQVTAWQRVSFAGAEVLHIACMVSRSNHDDDVWLVMRRGERVSIECIQDEDIYLDSYIRVVVEGGQLRAAHLAGQEVCYYPEHQADAARSVTLGGDGVISGLEDHEGSSYIIGCRMQSHLETFPVEQGSSYNTVSQQARVKLRLLESGASFRYRASHVERWEKYDPERDHLEYPYTGAIRVTQIPDPGVGQGFAIATDGLHPFNLLSLSIENDFHGR